MRWMRWFNRASLAFWILMVPTSHLTGWVDSNRYISDLSMIALIWTALICVQGDSTPKQVVAEIVDRTELNEAVTDAQEETGQ